jgi:gas vesicle protein
MSRMFKIANSPYAVPAALVGTVFAAWYLNRTFNKHPGHKTTSQITAERTREGPEKLQSKAAELKGKMDNEAQHLRGQADRLTDKGTTWLRWGSDKANEAVRDVHHTMESAEGEISKNVARTTEATKDKAVDLGVKTGEEARQVRDRAVDTGSSWLRWGADKTAEAGHDAEGALEKTEEKALHKAGELKKNLVETAKEVKDRAKDSAHGWVGWGEANYEKSEELKQQVNNKSNVEANKSSSTVHARTEDVKSYVKDTTDTADQIAEDRKPGKVKN